MGPQPIIEEVWEDVIPPPMVCSHLILPFLKDPMEGILGDLQNFPQHFFKQKRRGELPRVLTGNVPTWTPGYEPYCQSA